MRFETYVALRYLRGKRKNRFVSLITLISVAGVSVGVIALIVVLSVMTGFDIALRATIIGNRAHLTIQDRRGPMTDPDAVITEVKSLCPEIVACGPFDQVECLLVNREGRRNPLTSGAFIMGVDPQREQEVSQLAENLTHANGRTFGKGRLPDEKEIVLGYLLAEQLRVGIGDVITVVTYNPHDTPLGTNPASKLWLTVSGIAQAQMSDWDRLYAFVNLPTASMLTGREGADAIHCRLTDPFLATAVGGRILRELGYMTTTWYESQQAFFEALKQEKLAMFIILVFIILVAAFNIASTLIMVVMEKRRDIGILRTIGVSRPSILLLFIQEGLFIGLTGTIVGVAAGTALAYNINPVAEFIAGLFHIDLFNSQIYYFDRIPVAVVPWDVAWITVAAVILTFISTLYPAWSASRLDPVDALRYE